MKIIDLNGKERNIDSIKKIKHEVYDAINDEYIEVDYVEVEIIGKYRDNWKEWYPLDEFKDMNPERVFL